MAIPRVGTDKKMRIKRRYKFFAMIGLGFTAYLTGCATTPPSDTENACVIFYENKSWYRHMKRTEKRWGMPVHIQLAIMYQESSFVRNAKPPRKKILWVIPGPRPSSAYGYAQAQNTTWDWYKSETGRRGADRNDFKDASDFIGWYGDKSREMSNISLWDTRNQYLAFHEGHGGYNRQTYKKKDWLLGVANKVQKKSEIYGAQLKSCEVKLNKRFGFF
jgi:hypothetical protein